MDSDKENEELDWVQKEDVTPDQVLKTEGLEYLTREQAEELTVFIRTISALLFVILEKEQNDPKVIELYPTKNKKRAA